MLNIDLKIIKMNQKINLQTSNSSLTITCYTETSHIH